MVRKSSYPVLPSKAEYFLSFKGESLLPIIEAMNKWGDSYREEFSTQAQQQAVDIGAH